jgi:hypothetical protein
MINLRIESVNIFFDVMFRATALYPPSRKGEKSRQGRDGGE